MSINFLRLFGVKLKKKNKKTKQLRFQAANPPRVFLHMCNIIRQKGYENIFLIKRQCCQLLGIFMEKRGELNHVSQDVAALMVKGS